MPTYAETRAEEPANAPATEGANVASCGICGSVNPVSYRFCAVCGGTLPRQDSGRPAAPKPSASQPRMAAVPAPATMPPIVPVRAAAEGPPIVQAGLASAMTGPAAAPPPGVAPVPPAAAPPPIAVAAVVQIAGPAQPRATVFTCARCQGQNDGLARFCKYCGAPIAGGALASQGAASAQAAAGQAASAPAASAPAASAQAVAAAPAQAAVVEKTGPHPLIKASEAARLSPPAKPSPPAFSASSLGVPAHLLSAQPPTPDTIQTRAPGSEDSAPGPAPRAAEASAPAQPAPAKSASARARLVVVVEDGSDGKSFELKGPVVTVGRTEGDVMLFDDPYVSPRHAKLVERDGQWRIQDLHSVNHVYVRVRGRKPLESGDLILLGSQVLQFQLVSEEERQLEPANQHGTRVFGSKPVTRLARLDQRTVDGLVGDVTHIHRDETVLGRENGDLVFTTDAFLSRRHAVIRRDATSGRFHLEDLDSSNGTYVAIVRETPLETGDRVRIGQHLFRFERAP